MKKPLPKPAILALIVAAGLIVLVVGWFVVVRPLSHKAGNLRQQAAAVQQQIVSDLEQVAATRSGRATPVIKVADLYRLATAMPSAVDLPDLLLELSQTAKASKVALTSISPSGPVPVPAGNYSKETIAVAATGGYFDVANLIHRLGTLVTVDHGALQANGRLFSIDDVSLTPLGKTSVTAQLTLGAYVYGTGTPTSSSVSSTTTTTTTTGTTTTSSGPSAAGAP